MNNNIIQTLHPDAHSALRIDETHMVHAIASSHLLHVRANEVTQAACAFPLFFSRDNVNANWAISALCAFSAQKNLYVQGGDWTAGFTPKSVKTQPLMLVKADNEKGYDIGINTAHATVNNEVGENLFDDNQKRSLYLIEKSRLLESGLSDDALTFKTLKRLEQHNLIADVDMIIDYADGSKQAINGLATPNEASLAQLSAEVLFELQKDGVLMMLHAMLMSLFQVNSLIRLHNKQENVTKISNIKFEAPKSRTASELL